MSVSEEGGLFERISKICLLPWKLTSPSQNILSLSLFNPCINYNSTDHHPPPPPYVPSKTSWWEVKDTWWDLNTHLDMNIEFFLPPPPFFTARECFDFFGKNGWHLNVIDSNGIYDQCRRSKSIVCGVSGMCLSVLLVFFVFKRVKSTPTRTIL